MKRMLLLSCITTLTFAAENKKEYGTSVLAHTQLNEDTFYGVQTPLMIKATVRENSSDQQVQNHGVNINGVDITHVKNCLIPKLMEYQAQIEQEAEIFHIEFFQRERYRLMSELEKQSLSIDERVLYSKQIHQLMNVYNSQDVQNFLTVEQSEDSDEARCAYTSLKTCFQFGTLTKEQMYIIKGAYYNRLEFTRHLRDIKAYCDMTPTVHLHAREFYGIDNALEQKGFVYPTIKNDEVNTFEMQRYINAHIQHTLEMKEKNEITMEEWISINAECFLDQIMLLVNIPMGIIKVGSDRINNIKNAAEKVCNIITGQLEKSFGPHNANEKMVEEFRNWYYKIEKNKDWDPGKEGLKIGVAFAPWILIWASTGNKTIDVLLSTAKKVEASTKIT